MSDLFWPGDERAGDAMSETALLQAMVRVEAAWLATLADAGIAETTADLGGLVGEADVPAIAADAESAANPVLPLLALIRERLGVRDEQAASWLHRGLTSQDTLDTAIVLCLRDVGTVVRRELEHQVGALVDLTERHRNDVMAGRTLGRHAVPVTFGLKSAGWLQGVLDAVDDIAATERLPAQLGGAAGTLAASTALASDAGLGDAARSAQGLAMQCASRLGLAARPPWHTNRAPITRVGDALVGCTDAWGHIANDVLSLSRPEVGEVTEPAGRGASSTMPHKQNPVLSTLIRRAALAAPTDAARLHLAAADTHDERPTGGWHLEWATLRSLARHAVTASSQTTELLTGLHVDAARMRTNAEGAADALLSERDAFSSKTGPVDSYLGATDLVIGAALDRARRMQTR
ncbi:lyase family protein [Solicola gregarius]|uniref:Lyase family protein n=1 Tax=Solicola gregarius TaxID=2908642 RepID=A0AA46TLQ4_9ACTN|nr:lyase family protein [Solicola gregarius]UYM06743.1 lyase family protein [Solicola gregarius]